MATRKEEITTSTRRYSPRASHASYFSSQIRNCEYPKEQTMINMPKYEHGALIDMLKPSFIDYDV